VQIVDFYHVMEYRGKFIKTLQGDQKHLDNNNPVLSSYGEGQRTREDVAESLSGVAEHGEKKLLHQRKNTSDIRARHHFSECKAIHRSAALSSI
jgi:hypothetical protein